MGNKTSNAIDTTTVPPTVPKLIRDPFTASADTITSNPAQQTCTPSAPSPLSRVAFTVTEETLPSPNILSDLYKTRSASKSLHRKQNSALLICDNGITGKYISSRICKIAAHFWSNNIDAAPFSERIEIGCSIFFGMMSSSVQMSKIMKANMPKGKEWEKTGVRYLDMIGWVIRNMLCDHINLYEQFTKLGAIHSSMGINIEHYPQMLFCMHETFAYYFATKYTIEIKYALDEIFSLSASIMTGDIESHLKDLNQEFGGNNIPFLRSLDVCLSSSIGSEYLYRFLGQTWCEEIVVFLQQVSRFKKLMSDKERYFVAKDITKLCIESDATFSLNLSYATRQTALREIYKLEKQFVDKETFKIGIRFFADVEFEVRELIQKNHWIKFVQDIEILKLKSFNVEFQF